MEDVVKYKCETVTINLTWSTRQRAQWQQLGTHWCSAGFIPEINSGRCQDLHILSQPQKETTAFLDVTKSIQ